MQHPEPQDEHKWLQRLIGNWTMEGECSMGPEQPPMKTSGTDNARPFGGLWVLLEGGGTCESLMTLGFDPAKKKYVGTFVATVMNHLWVYEGTREGDVLTLDTVGPSFSGDGSLVPYQDIIEFKSDDHRILRSQSKGPDGKWVHFMEAHYRRVK